MIRARGFVAIAVLLLPIGISAEPDTFGFGTGRSGPLQVPPMGPVVNAYARVTAPLAPGDTLIQISSPSGAFSAGDLIMVLQTTGIIPEPDSGVPGPFNLSADPVGRWELARLASGSPGVLQLSAPLINSYAAAVTQVIRVPEYGGVSVSAGFSVLAAPWDGGTGGVVAFLANSTLVNDGQIRADSAGPIAAGFRGGQLVNDSRLRDGGLCSALDEPAADGGQKGEGIAVMRYPAGSGRGNVANAGGGGDCFNAGGGGGGNGGPGGDGGFSWVGEVGGGSRNVGGIGGGALSFSALTRLALGGGGGAGHENSSLGSAGGRGGGIVFIRGDSMLNTSGTITANGQSGASAGIEDGAGGGGAGGTIYLRFVHDVFCGNVMASGGDGGSTPVGGRGPGGGGGAGHILIQGASINCPTVALSGLAGVQPDGGRYGATPSVPTVGVVEIPDGGFRILSPPTIATPAEGSSTDNRRLLISGTADPNVIVIVYLDGIERARPQSDGAGNFSFLPSFDLALGTHRVQAASEFQAVQSVRSLVRTFTIVAADAGTDGGTDREGNPDAGSNSGPEFLGGGCNCQSFGGGFLVPLALLSAAVALRKRASISTSSSHRW